MICDDVVDLARVDGTIAVWGAGGGAVVKILSCVVRPMGVLPAALAQ
jgi:hypothetical protein